jgi:hypothetical protein
MARVLEVAECLQSATVVPGDTDLTQLASASNGAVSILQTSVLHTDRRVWPDHLHLVAVSTPALLLRRQHLFTLVHRQPVILHVGLQPYLDYARPKVGSQTELEISSSCILSGLSHVLQIGHRALFALASGPRCLKHVALSEEASPTLFDPVWLVPVLTVGSSALLTTTKCMLQVHAAICDAATQMLHVSLNSICAAPHGR